MRPTYCTLKRRHICNRSLFIPYTMRSNFSPFFMGYGQAYEPNSRSRFLD